MASKDSMLGDILDELPIYKSGFDRSGEILLCRNGIIVRHNGETVKAPFEYVKYIDATDKMALGRVRANVNIFDQIHGNMDLVFEISDMHFEKLLKACGKK